MYNVIRWYNDKGSSYLQDGALNVYFGKKMYNKVDTNLEFVDRKAGREFWKDNDIFKKSMEQRKQGETYTFYDGPTNRKRQAAYRSCGDAYDQGYDRDFRQ